MRVERAKELLPPMLLWAVAVVVIGVVLWMKPNARTVYSIYNYAGRGWSEGREMYVLPPNSPVVDNFRYSPLIAAGFAALYQLPVRVGGLLWRLLGVALAMGGFAYACRTLDANWERRTAWQRRWCWVILLPLCVINIHSGQANLHVVGLLLIAVASASESRWNLSAGCFALACLIKVYPVALVMLYLVLYPRQLSLRFLAALAIGLVLPYLTQTPAFVNEEYRIWLQVMGADNRMSPEVGTLYRDLSLLLFRLGMALDRQTYFLVQAGLGAATAVVCLYAKWRLRWGSPRLLTFTYFQGTFWMLLCGPCTESSTYVLLAPLAAWLVVDACCGKFSKPAAAFILLGAGLVHLALFATAFPFFPIVHKLGIHPLGTLIMLIGYLGAEFGAKNVDNADRSIAADSMASMLSASPVRRSA